MARVAQGRCVHPCRLVGVAVANHRLSFRAIPSHRAVCTHTYLPTAFACSTLPTVHEIRFPVPTHPCAWIRAPFRNAIHPQIASGGLHRSRLTARDRPRSTSHGSHRRNRHTDGIIHRDLVRRLGCVGGFRSRRKAL